MEQDEKLLEKFIAKGFDPNVLKVGYPLYKLNLSAKQKIYVEITNSPIPKLSGEFQDISSDLCRIQLKKCREWETDKKLGNKILYKANILDMKLVGEDNQLLEVPKHTIEEKVELAIEKIPDNIKKHWQKNIESYAYINSSEMCQESVKELLKHQVVGVSGEFDSKSNLCFLIITTHFKIYVMGRENWEFLKNLEPIFKNPVTLKVGYNLGSLIHFFKETKNVDFRNFVDLKIMLESKSPVKHECFGEYVSCFLEMTEEEVGSDKYEDADLYHPNTEELLLDISYKWGYLLPLYESVLRSTLLNQFQSICLEYANSHKTESYSETLATFTKTENQPLKKIMEKYSNFLKNLS